jgi:hypothetical protein
VRSVAGFLVIHDGFRIEVDALQQLPSLKSDAQITVAQRIDSGFGRGGCE